MAWILEKRLHCIDAQRRQMMATHTKTPKGGIDPLNRYGIADAARTRITEQIIHNITKPNQKTLERTVVPKPRKAQKQV